MPHVRRAPPARRIRIRRARATGLLVAVVALAVAVGHMVPASPSPSPSPSPSATVAASPPATPAADVPRPADPGDLGAADGAVPDDTTVFDDHVPGVAGLDPALLRALRAAATDAAGDGVAFLVDSGRRSPAYQRRLLDEAIARYGSEAEAARWVATPETSAHVSGDAVDIGGADAMAWLSAYGRAHGLCQTYRNEPWHYELRPDAAARGCPPPYADPTEDPRMRG